MNHAHSLSIQPRGDREVVITRLFSAPRHLVYNALTQPALIRRWLLGPDGWTMPVCDVDLRVGGKYRYVWRKDKTNHEMGMGGEFREIVPNERLVMTEQFDDPWYPDGPALNTTVLAERDGATTMTVTMLAPSAKAREMVLKSGMEHGVRASYDRMEQVLASAAVA